MHAENLSLSYGSTEALADASASVEAGEIVAITGPSGSGKTSLLYCLAALLRPDAGRVTFRDMDLTGLGNEALAALRRQHFGFVFQFAELVPELSLRDNISLPLELLRVPRSERRERVEGLLARLDLAEHADRRPDQVSGGQAQRAAVGRAMVHRPSVVFADEPTGSLDSRNGERVLELFLAASREAGAAVVLVTHDAHVASWADREVSVSDGRIDASVTC